jgi:hypothetical protein
MARLLAALLLSSASATASAYLVHKHSKEHSREAQWTRTRCGSVATPGSDQITQWGALVTPDNVLQEYPRMQVREGVLAILHCPALQLSQLLMAPALH